MKSVHLQVLPSQVALITIDDRGSKINVLSCSLMSELEATLDALAACQGIEGVVFVSGKEGFIAGANLEEIASIQWQPPVVAYDAAQKGKQIFAKIAALPYPTVAAVRGVCLGGGTELALACSYRLADSSAKFGLPEVALGFLPGWGGTVRLTTLIGAQAAMGLVLQPLKTFDARKAWRAGLVDELVPSAQALVQRAQELVFSGKPNRAKMPLKSRVTRLLLERTRLGRKALKTIATKQVFAETKGLYPAPPQALKVMLAALTLTQDQAFALESRVFSELAVTPESRNLVGFFFAVQDSKKSALSGRPTVKVKKVGVLGAGVMGAGIAQAALHAGFDVVLYDKFEQALEKGRLTIASLLAGLVARGKLSSAAADATISRLTATANFEDLAGCDLVVEAIVEDLCAKQSALRDLELVIGKEFIFATNTSSLSVCDIAAEAAIPGNVAGLHFFNPVPKMPLVEVVAGDKTSPQTVAVLKSFAGRLGKTAVSTADAPGFVVNRILAPYLYESIRLMELGVPLKDIDDAMTKFGMKMGPLALLDEVGLDISTKVIHVLHAALGERLAPPAVLEIIAREKLLGKKSGQGIYVYDAQGKPVGFNSDLVQTRVELTKRKGLGKLPLVGKRFGQPGKSVSTLIGAGETRKSREELQDRLTLVIINEAARCIEEGIVDDASQLDLAMIMGTGFPALRGGVLRYADALGARDVVWKLEQLAKVSGANYEPCARLRQMAANGKTFYLK